MATATTTDRFSNSAAGAEYVKTPRPVVAKATTVLPMIPLSDAPDESPLTRYFDAAERRQLAADDLSAGTSVAIILTAVVGLGMVAMIGTVLYTLL